MISFVHFRRVVTLCSKNGKKVQLRHSLIRGVLIQNCPAGAKNFTNYVFCHVQFDSSGQSSKNHCGIKAKFWKIDFYYIKLIILIIINIDKQGQNGTTIFNILDNTTELWMTKYIICEIFSSGGATLYKNPSDQTVLTVNPSTFTWVNPFISSLK